LPKATAERLLASPFLRDDVRAALRQLLRPFAEVSDMPVAVEECDNLLSRPLPEAYRPLLGLCRLLAGAMRPGEHSGPVPAPAFLLDMECVFERYLTTRLTAAFDEPVSLTRVTAQPLFAVSEAVAGQPDLTVRPDLVLAEDGRNLVIVDAKWKRLDDSPLVTADVYQMLAYCTALGVRRGVLVYPGRGDRRWQYRLTGSPVTLTVRRLRVVGDGEALTASVLRLARWLRRQCGAARQET
jgi:5-methylcytosine-specific restriction enzyme subunit McrC